MQSTAITKQQKVLIIRNGIEVWLDADETGKLEDMLINAPKEMRLFKFKDRIFNTADIIGLFLPQDMDIMERRKMGQWKCDKGQWHARNEECDCKRVRLNGASPFKSF